MASYNLHGFYYGVLHRLHHIGILLVGLIVWSGCVGIRLALDALYTIRNFGGADLLIAQAVAVGVMCHLAI